MSLNRSFFFVRVSFVELSKQVNFKFLFVKSQQGNIVASWEIHKKAGKIVNP